MLTTILVFIFGLLLGALLNLVIIRLPRERRLLGWPRCTRTGAPLAWWQLLPVIGWLLQRGRAADGRRLHWIYPVVELLTAFTLLRIYALYGLSPAFGYLSFACAVLIVTGAIDWLHRYIYTFVILGATLLALIAGPLVGMDWRNVLLGALVAGFIFMLFYMAARIIFPSAAVPFGLGDVYLAIFIGAAVGIVNLMPAIFIGMLLAGLFSAALLLMRRAGWPGVPEYISYGTFLCIGALGYLLARGL